jgi:DNA polymerase I-like protein with 3'-5' exonuclease and polymerase domains
MIELDHSLVIILDCETDGLLDSLTRLHLVSYCYRTDEGELKSGVVPLKMALGDPIPANEHTKGLIDILTNRKVTVGNTTKTLVPCFHGAEYDISVLSLFGFPEPVIFHDTLIAGWLLCPTVEEELVTTISSKTLKPVKKHSKYSLAAWGQRLGLAERKLSRPDFSEYSAALETYGERDARSQCLLAEYILPRLQEDAKAWNLYSEIELPYLHVIRQLQSAGIHFDLSKLLELKTTLSEKHQFITSKMAELVGLVPLGKWSKTLHPRNGDDVTDNESDAIPGMFKYLGKEIDKKDNRERYTYRAWTAFSPNSLAHKLYALKKLYGFESPKRTASGNEALDKEVLKSLEYPLAQLLSEYSVYEKLMSTYINKFIDSGGVLKGSWIQYGTVTGRISSRNPNFQNLPARGEFGDAIRDTVIARSPDHRLVGIDLDQIELRVLSWYLVNMFKDELDDYPDAKVLWDCFHAGGDPHQLKADEANVSRSVAKTFNFGDLYGSGYARAASIIGCTVEKAKALMDEWRAATPATQELKRRVWDKASKNGGVVHTLYGRRLVYPDICLPVFSWKERQSNRSTRVLGNASVEELCKRRAEAQRQVFNALIQGTAADIFKILASKATIKLLKIGGIPILNVHDEYVVDVLKDHDEEAKTILNQVFCMTPENSLLPGLPITAEAKVGRTWKECK